MSEPELFIHEDVLARLSHLPNRPYEVGGWLLGYWSDDTSCVVTHATPPGRRGTPAGVRISGAGHREKFDAAWDATYGAVTYLGDWHTHPGCPPLPSVTDFAAMEKLSTDDRYGTPVPIMAIVMTSRWPPSATAHRLGMFARVALNALHGLAPQVITEHDPSARLVPRWNWPVSRRARPPLKLAPATPLLVRELRR